MLTKILLDMAALCRLLFILLCVNVSLASKVAGIDIDKFLKKVILSEKFDEIADKIAEKAASKITNMKNIEIKAIGNTVNQKELTYRVSDNEYKNNDTKKLQSNSDVITPHRHINEEVIKYTMREIDIGNKKELVPIDGLVLKYKHFTKQDQNSSDTFVEHNRKGKTLKNISFLQRSEQDKLKDKRNQLQRPVQTAKLQSNEILDNASDANKDNSSEYVLMSYENINNESTGIPEAVEEVVKTENMTFKNKADENEKSVSTDEQDSLNLEFEENYKAFLEYKKQQNDQKTMNSNPIDVQDSPSLEEVETTVNESSEEEKITTRKVVSKISETLENEHDDTTRTLVRQEGDKLYTYEKSPDYKEYHEQFALQRKTMKTV